MLCWNACLVIFIRSMPRQKSNLIQYFELSVPFVIIFRWNQVHMYFIHKISNLCCIKCWYEWCFFLRIGKRIENRLCNTIDSPYPWNFSLKLISIDGAAVDLRWSCVVIAQLNRWNDVSYRAVCLVVCDAQFNQSHLHSHWPICTSCDAQFTRWKHEFLAFSTTSHYNNLMP